MAPALALHNQPQRSVPSGHDRLWSFAPLSAEELERLDRSGISGLQVRGLGTQHLYAKRLRKQPQWERLEELANDLPAEWRALLEKLGYDIEQLPQRNYLLRADGKPTALVRP